MSCPGCSVSSYVLDLECTALCPDVALGSDLVGPHLNVVLLGQYR